MQNTPNKVTLVFGGSRGIGAAIVGRMARDGHAVAFTYVRSGDHAKALADTIVTAGGNALPLQADSADPAAIREAVAQTVGHFGPIDAVIINAGIFSLGTVEAITLENLDQMLAVNVRGVFLSIQAAAPKLKDNSRVITIGSNVAIRTGLPGASVYQMTKAAVAAMVKGIALDLAPRGITVNNVQPGPTDTDITAGLIEILAEKSPLKRVARPEEIAGLVAYLARDEAAYITGASLTIDGGLTL